jgi:hypothetical protein
MTGWHGGEPSEIFKTMKWLDGMENSEIFKTMAIKHIIVLFVETQRKFITAKLSIHKPGSSSVLIHIQKLIINV